MLFPAQFISMFTEDFDLKTKVKLDGEEEYAVKAKLSGRRESRVLDNTNTRWSCSLYIMDTRLGLPSRELEIGLIIVDELNSFTQKHLNIPSYHKLSEVTNHDKTLLECLFKLSFLLGYAGSFIMEVTEQERNFYKKMGFVENNAHFIGNGLTPMTFTEITLNKWKQYCTYTQADLEEAGDFRSKREAAIEAAYALEEDEEGLSDTGSLEENVFTFTSPLMTTDFRASESSRPSSSLSPESIGVFSPAMTSPAFVPTTTRVGKRIISHV